MGLGHLSLITKPLDKMWIVNSFKSDPARLLFPSYFHDKSLNLTENLICHLPLANE